MYITFAGLPAGELVKAGGPARKFVNDFKAKYGHDPASAYAIYGAAAFQYILKAIERPTAPARASATLRSPARSPSLQKSRSSARSSASTRTVT